MAFKKIPQEKYEAYLGMFYNSPLIMSENEKQAEIAKKFAKFCNNFESKAGVNPVEVFNKYTISEALVGIDLSANQHNSTKGYHLNVWFKIDNDDQRVHFFDSTYLGPNFESGWGLDDRQSSNQYRELLLIALILAHTKLDLNLERFDEYDRMVNEVVDMFTS